MLSHNAVWIEWSQSDRECTILGIRRGRLASDLTISLPPGERELERLRETVFRSCRDGKSDPLPYRRKEIDEIRVIASWIYRKRERLEVVPVGLSESTAEVLDRVEASIRRAS